MLTKEGELRTEVCGENVEQYMHYMEIYDKNG